MPLSILIEFRRTPIALTDLREIRFTLESSSVGSRCRLDGLQKSTEVAGPGVQFNRLFSCGSQGWWVGELNLWRSGLECLRVARESPWSVACSSSAVELVAVGVLLVLTSFHLLTPSCFTSSQFEIVLLLSRFDPRSLLYIVLLQ